MIKSIYWNPTLQVMGIFFIQPVVFGVWLALIPEVQSSLNLDKSQLALGLMGTPTGMLTDVTICRKNVTNTFGIRKILYVGFPFFFFSITLIGLVDGLYSLFLVLFLVGVSMSLLDTGIERSRWESRKTYTACDHESLPWILESRHYDW